MFLLLSCLVLSKVYFQETFQSLDRWTLSEFKDDFGLVEISTGKYYDVGNKEDALGLKTTQDLKFYALSAALDTPLDNSQQTLVLQFAVKHEQNIDCGGGYLKLFPNVDLKQLHGDTQYYIMFGPDVCGGTKKTHFILNYNDKNYENLNRVVPPADQISHLYTLIIRTDKTYSILVDNKSQAEGNVLEDFSILPPKRIPDSSVSKPEDWVDVETSVDSNDVKPESWDDRIMIDDVSAKMPLEWDEEADGEWNPPQVPNPNYVGPWKPRLIANPDFKGFWKQPEIDNPDYYVDESIGHYVTAFVGIDIWQVKSGSIFDDILITDDVNEAAEKAELFLKKQSAEKVRKVEVDKEEEEEAKKAGENQKETTPLEDTGATEKVVVAEEDKDEL